MRDEIVPEEVIEHKIFLIREQKVGKHTGEIRETFVAIHKLMNPPVKPIKKFGFYKEWLQPTKSPYFSAGALIKTDTYLSTYLY